MIIGPPGFAGPDVRLFIGPAGQDELRYRLQRSQHSYRLYSARVTTFIRTGGAHLLFLSLLMLS